MYRATVNLVRGLDQQYLEFASRTRPIFSRYPQIEPLRYVIFKHLLVQRSSIGYTGYVKHWLRPLIRRARSRGPLNRADVLIWVETCRETSIGALLPVYRELESRGVKARLVFYRRPANLPFSTLHFQFPARAIPPAWTRDAWDALCNVVKELHCEQLRRSFNYACANIQGLFDELDRILDAIRPKIVLNTGTQHMGGAGLVITSRLRGALTLILQHGMLQPFYVPLLADYMLTWGPSSNEALFRLGVPTRRLIALGSPRHDSMFPSAPGTARGALRRALSLPDRPTFVFFSNGNDLVRNGSAPIECAEWLEETAAQYDSDITIIVRLHPNEDGSIYRNCPHLRITKNSPDLATTLDGCDWVGSLCSTVMYEALLYKKPVWQFYADGWPDLADNWKGGLAVRISSQAELRHMVGCMLGGETDSFVGDDMSSNVFANHGHATQAVADFVQRHLEEKGKAVSRTERLSRPR